MCVPPSPFPVLCSALAASAVPQSPRILAGGGDTRGVPPSILPTRGTRARRSALLLPTSIQIVKRHLLLQKTATQVIRNLLWFEKAAVVTNPDVLHPRLLVEHLLVGGCHGRSLPDFINIFLEEQHASGCRLLSPALGICSWEMSLPCPAHFGALYLSDLRDLQMAPWGCKEQHYKSIF